MNPVWVCHLKKTALLECLIFPLTSRSSPVFLIFPDYDLSKLKDFMDQQVDSYIEKGIIAKDEGDTIKRIYSSL